MLHAFVGPDPSEKQIKDCIAFMTNNKHRQSELFCKCSSLCKFTYKPPIDYVYYV